MKDPKKPWLPNMEIFKGTWRDDWRIRGQEGYLKGKHLQHRRFDRQLCHEDFTQCEFCWATFDEDPNAPLTAYFEPNEGCWICEDCYNDFLEHFLWTAEDIL